jgi:hypothetical protein
LDFLPKKRYYGTDYPNNDISYEKDLPFILCESTCKKTDKCVGYTVDLNNGTGCWLKNLIDPKNAIKNNNRDTYTIDK